MKKWAQNFYTGSKWKKCREAYIAERNAIDGGLCEECGELPGYIVHHILSLNEVNISDPDIALNFKNLKYVCKICHDKFDGHFLNNNQKNKVNLSKRVLFFDESGDPSPPTDE